MVGMQNLIPQWLHREQHDMPAEEIAPLPQVATLPEPAKEFSAEDQDKMIFGRAAVMLEQLKRNEAEALKREQSLQAELAESVLARAGDQKKIQLLELDYAELQNNLQTVQADLLEKDRCLSLLRQVLDKFGTKAPPKKERKPNAPKRTKAERKAAKETTAENGTAQEKPDAI